MYKSKIKKGDIFDAFDKNGNCFGAEIWQGGNTSITLFGDDPLTEEKDGFGENDHIAFRLWTNETEEVVSLDVSFDKSMPNPDAVFNNHGLSAISEMKISSTGISGLESGVNIQIIPNPATDEFMLALDRDKFSACMLTIYSLDGQKVGQFKISSDKENFNIEHLNPGIYILEIKVDGNVFNKRLVKH